MNLILIKLNDMLSDPCIIKDKEGQTIGDEVFIVKNFTENFGNYINYDSVVHGKIIDYFGRSSNLDGSRFMIIDIGQEFDYTDMNLNAFDLLFIDNEQILDIIHRQRVKRRDDIIDDVL